MDEETNHLVQNIAEVFYEFMQLTKLDWGKAYFRFVEYDLDHVSAEWSYSLGRKLILAIVERDLEVKYRERLQELLTTLFNKLTELGKPRPKVAVVSVANDKEYSIKFSHDNINANLISILDLTSRNSFFSNGEVDIPHHLLDSKKWWEFWK